MAFLDGPRGLRGREERRKRTGNREGQEPGSQEVESGQRILRL